MPISRILSTRREKRQLLLEHLKVLACLLQRISQHEVHNRHYWWYGN